MRCYSTAEFLPVSPWYHHIVIYSDINLGPQQPAVSGVFMQAVMAAFNKMDEDEYVSTLLNTDLRV